MPHKYQYIKDGEYYRTCECCGCTAPLTKTERARGETPRKQEKFYICELCSGSYAFNAVLYPRQYDEATLKTIAQIGNIILDKTTDRTEGMK